MGDKDSAEIERKARKFDELVAGAHAHSTPERVRESLNLLCDKKTMAAIKEMRRNRMRPQKIKNTSDV
ncbi:MAG: hypothetical protein ABSD68_02030 [Candidatus Micrarchaeales archaeon]|jgi:hypothetical protein